MNSFRIAKQGVGAYLKYAPIAAGEGGQSLHMYASHMVKPGLDEISLRSLKVCPENSILEASLASIANRISPIIELKSKEALSDLNACRGLVNTRVQLVHSAIYV